MSAKAPAPEGSCVFLDRDGVVNRRSVTLVRDETQLEILPGVPEAVARLTEAGYRIVVVTNQRPVAWGIIVEADLAAIHDRIRQAFEQAGGRVDAIKACRHGFFTDCACGKPEPGMLEAAGEELDLVPEHCWMVGDKGSDVEAGRRFGARTVWVTGQHFPWERFRSAPEADHVVDDLPEAVDRILAEETAEA
jgi:D-glycero-D-manno-heptose 1,7-bisphosphate phosphatase